MSLSGSLEIVHPTLWMSRYLAKQLHLHIGNYCRRRLVCAFPQLAMTSCYGCLVVFRNVEGQNSPICSNNIHLCVGLVHSSLTTKYNPLCIPTQNSSKPSCRMSLIMPICLPLSNSLASRNLKTSITLGCHSSAPLSFFSRIFNLTCPCQLLRPLLDVVLFDSGIPCLGDLHSSEKNL